MIPLLAGLAGLAGLALLWWAKRKSPGLSALSAVTGAWMLVLPVFLVVNYKVVMIGKHLFFTVVPLSLGVGIFFLQLAQRGGKARLFCFLSAGVLDSTALLFWVQRFVQASG